MAPSKKVNVKERYNDGEIDLSMSDLQDVPVKEIALLKKTTALDLSNNSLTLLPSNFPTLVNLTKLDLSKNELRELPQDFGNLSRLKYLDLYKNQLAHLPLSISKLKDLRFLDLKDNPLVPTVAKVAGPCINTKDCQNCAKNIVVFFTKLQQQVDTEVDMRNKSRKKQLELNQQKRQEEKKIKKIEQQKKKQEDFEVQKTNAKKNKKDKKVKNGTISDKLRKKNTKTNIMSLFYLAVLSFFVTVITLFILTSTNLKQTQVVEEITKNLYFSLTDKLPPHLQEYSFKTGDIINQLHNKTGSVTLDIVETLRLQDRVYFLRELILNVYNYSLEKITNVYNDFVQKKGK